MNVELRFHLIVRQLCSQTVTSLSEVLLLLDKKDRPLTVANVRLFKIELFRWRFQSSIGSAMISSAVTQRAKRAPTPQ